MEEIDEYHELCIRARDEMRELTDFEEAEMGEIWYEVQRNKFLEEQNGTR
jgi:hypothetical protein